MSYDLETINNNFKYHEPKQGEGVSYCEVRLAAKQLARLFLKVCPESAERTIAFRKLEGASMWANASIARKVEIE